MKIPDDISNMTPRVWQEVMTIVDGKLVEVAPDSRFQEGLKVHMFEFVSRLRDTGEEFRFGYCTLESRLGATALEHTT